MDYTPAGRGPAAASGEPRTDQVARPVVLLAGHPTHTLRWLREAFRAQGFAVVAATETAEAVDRGRYASPDLVILGPERLDRSLASSRDRLRVEAQVGPETPILVVSATAIGDAQRLAALRAGAWDVLAPPLDLEELTLKVDRFVRAKRTADAAVAGGLFDPETGVYSADGLGRRAEEAAALAARERRPFACVVCAFELPDESEARPGDVRAALRAWARRLDDVTRQSDVVGRLGHARFGVVAPDTPASGATALAERVRRVLAQAPTPIPLQLRAGYAAVENFAQAPVTALELLDRASAHSRRTRWEGGARWIAGDTVDR